MANDAVTSLHGIVVTLSVITPQFVAVTLKFRGDDDTPATITLPVRAAIGGRLQLGEAITLDISRT